MDSRAADEDLAQSIGIDVPPIDFVTLTGPLSDTIAGKAASKIVRSQAMRNYIWKQNHPSMVDGGDTKVHGKAQGQGQYKGKFRLGSSSQQPKTMVTNRPEKRHDTISRQHRTLGSSNSMVFVNNRLDPFDSFVLALGRESEMLINHYFSTFRMNSVAVNPDGNFFSYARTDPALFHSTLYLVALDYNFRLGMPASSASLSHGGEAIRLIKERLRERELGDMTIAAVALLVTKENLDGKYDLSKVHMKGLEYMIKERGGLQNIKGIFQRIVTWSDLCYSNVWNCQPRLPRLPTTTKQEKIRLPLNDEVELLAPDDVFGADSPMVSVFQSLREASLALDSDYVSTVDRMTLSSQIYHLEYDILLLNKDDTKFLGPERRLSPGHLPLKIAAHTYLYLVMRELPSRSYIVSTLIARLQAALEIQNKEWWNSDTKRQKWLLWIQFIGYGAATGTAEKWWFVEHIDLMCRMLGIVTRDEFQRCLRSILWQEMWCGNHCRDLWSDFLKQEQMGNCRFVQDEA
ncbi:hypothetical protein PT974_03331 [Cladobotryum mycophilum]|uniref:Uncharacterized protein n=1 Tax=Cladobotryum mycophilum TaxID=491253 RepID=A0ABR0SRZ9_9HYPO